MKCAWCRRPFAAGEEACLDDSPHPESRFYLHPGCVHNYVQAGHDDEIARDCRRIDRYRVKMVEDVVLISVEEPTP